MQAPVFLTGQWKYLAMLNFEIDPAVLRGRVPPGTQLDDWNGRTLASVVGFMFVDTCVMGVKIPFHARFEEVNLRFYVRRKGPEGWRRGVVFIKEIVPRRAIATAARLFYNENYSAMPMRHHIKLDESGSESGVVEYGWRGAGRWNRLRALTAGRPGPLEEGSEAEFITEHYWGYALQRDGGAIEYQVEHPRWLVWQASGYELDCDVRRVYGPEFTEALEAKAASAFVASGSEITVRRGTRIQ